MSQPKVVIIGGGIAGLCAGVYLRRCGFETEILEMHAIAGGLATAWGRQGYTFENCIHWLVGFQGRGIPERGWKEVFDIGRLRFFEDTRLPGLGAWRRLHHDLPRSRPAGERASSQGPRGRHRHQGTRRADPALRPVSAFRGGFDRAERRGLARNDPSFPGPGQVRQADHGRIREAVQESSPARLLFGRDRRPVVPGPGLLARLDGRRQRRLSDRRLAGDDRADRGELPRPRRPDPLPGPRRARPRRVRRAAGVVLAGGETVAADIVVSAADGHATIFDLLGGSMSARGSEKSTRPSSPFRPMSRCRSASTPISPASRDSWPFSWTGRSASTRRPRRIPSPSACSIYDPTFAPPGKTAVVTFLGTYNHAYWEELRRADRAGYGGREAADRRRGPGGLRGSASPRPRVRSRSSMWPRRRRSSAIPATGGAAWRAG